MTANRMTPKELLSAIASSGYFSHPQKNQALFREVTELHLNISVERAIDLLTENGLVTFGYERNSDAHPRDIVDLWELELTSEGVAALSAEP